MAITYKAPHSLRPGYPKDHCLLWLLLILYEQAAIGVGMLKVSSIKQCHLMGPKKYPIFFIVPHPLPQSTSDPHSRHV